MKFVVSLLIVIGVVVLAVTSVMGASSYTPAKRVDNSLVQKAVHYSLPYPDESNISTTSSGKASGQPLGLVNPPSSQSPGMVIGYTWYDQQSNGSMGRQVDWGYDATYGYMVHFAWMFLPTRVIGSDRAYAYTAYYSADSSVPTFGPIQGSADYAGYVELDAMDMTNAGGHGAAVGGHNNPSGVGYASEIYYEADEPGTGFFVNSRVTDSVQCYETQYGNDYCAIWPTMRYQEVSGHDPVTHVFAQTSMSTGDPQAIYYFRKVGFAETGEWDYPPYVVDTVFNLSQDVACSNSSGKMALAWNANLVEDNLAACDTCSDNEGDSAVVNPQWENDLYCQINTNYGAPGFWQPRVNLTKNLRDEEGYRPYTDLSILMGSNDDVHIAWSASIWEGRETHIKDVWACRLFAWSESNGFNTDHADGFPRANTQTVADLNYPSEDYPDCGAGSWDMLACKMSISECNGRLYYLWTQFNDVANGITDDCASRAYSADDILGSANGELFLSVSTTLDGCLWDAPRNLTNSHTPSCDSVGGSGGRCDSDVWPSMARHGSNHVGALVDDSIIVDPSGSYSGGYYLPVSYIADPDAGAIVSDEGTWQQADVVWFQLACVPPVGSSTMLSSITEIGPPTMCDWGGTICSSFAIDNLGNQATNWSATAAITSGHPAGALTVTPTTGAISAGCSNTVDSLTICMANGLILEDAIVTGEITIAGDFDNSPLVIPVRFWVLRGFIPPGYDTIYCDDGTKANALALSVGNNGNFGESGGANGKVGLDYWVGGTEACMYDDQNEENPYLGDSRAYLYDGSPVICYDAGGGEINCNYSMFDYTYAGGGPNDGPLDGGFFPRENPAQTYPVWMSPQGTPNCNFIVREFVSRDTAILIEQVTIAPNIVEPQYMLQATRFSNLTPSPVAGLAIGEAIDWDIPSDSGSWNGAGYSSSLNLMYQYGEEYSQDTIVCTRNDERFGGLAVLDVFEDGFDSDDQYGMYAMDNATQVYPLGHFSPDSLFYRMTGSAGFTTADSAQYNDLHMVATYRVGHTLAASGGDLIVYTLLATQQSGSSFDFETTVAEGKQWYQDNFLRHHICCYHVGDINNSYNGTTDMGFPDIADLIYLVNFMFNDGPCNEMFNSGYVPCDEEGAILPDTDIDCNLSYTPDIADLIYLVSYMFQEGPYPPSWIDENTPDCMCWW